MLKQIRYTLWALAYDLFAYLTLDRAALFCVARMSDATDWGHGADCSGGSGEEPF